MTGPTNYLFMGKTINIRTQHSEKWYYGPKMSANDFETLLYHFYGSFVCFEADGCDTFFYDLSSESFKSMIDSLKAMSESDFKSTFRFEDEELYDCKDWLVEELEYLYDNRDMSWGEDGSAMWLSWY